MARGTDPREAFATAARGTEVALRDELRDLKFRGVRADRGGVHFAAPDLAEIGRACLESRIAVRVMLPLAEIDAHDEGALYDGVRAIDWRPYFTPHHTLAVSSTARSSALSHTQYIAQKTKDAIVDQLRDKLGERPNVDREDADVRVYVHLVRDRATVYLDASGESLHRRGYRPRIGTAPLKETLAAAIVRLSGWDRVKPLHDPMCGSGTLAIEADLWARDVAPGLLIERFGFERWAHHQAAVRAKMEELRAGAKLRIKTEGPDVLGSDVDPRVVELARENGKSAGSRARFHVAPIDALVPLDPPGLVITNPPYGERLEGDPRLYREMAAVFKRLPGHEIAIFSGTPAIEDAMQMRPLRSVPLWNGPIECRLLVYQVR
jgi:putative N6-adenine-specific DNA methylase